MAAIARGQITIVDLNDAKSLHLFLGSNSAATQIFNRDNKSYVPDYTGTSTHLVITPELYVSGTSSNIISSIKAAPVWSINGSQTLATFGGTVGTASPWALTISQNMTTVAQMRIDCTVTYTDPDTSVDLIVKASITITKSENAGSLCCAIATCPNGSIFKNNDVTSLKAHCDFWRGGSIDTTNVTYLWQKLVSGAWTNMRSANTGYNTNEITINASDVLNYETFRCKVTDTDPSSGQNQTTFYDYVSFSDLSDPYVVEVSSTTGDKIINGTGSTTLKAVVWQNGLPFSDTDATNKFVFTWTKYNSSGTLDTTWGDATLHTKTGASITVLASEVTGKGTFVCELSYK